MLSNKLKAYFDLTRPVNVAITVLSIPVASILAGATRVQWLEVLIAALTGGLVAAAANAINDYFDVEIDRLNKPTRPIPRGDATRREAWMVWFLLSALAIALNIVLNPLALGIVLVAVVTLYWYSALFKRTIVVGNFVVALMTAMAFIYGAVVIGTVQKAVVPALFAFLVNIPREIIKDIEDVEGDRKDQAITLAVKYGPKPGLWIATVSIVLLVATTIGAYELGVYTVYFLYPVLLVDILLVAVMIGMWMDQTPRAMNRLSNGLKLCMILGLVAIYLGSR